MKSRVNITIYTLPFNEIKSIIRINSIYELNQNIVIKLRIN